MPTPEAHLQAACARGPSQLPSPAALPRPGDAENASLVQSIPKHSGDPDESALQRPAASAGRQSSSRSSSAENRSLPCSPGEGPSPEPADLEQAAAAQQQAVSLSFGAPRQARPSRSSDGASPERVRPFFQLTKWKQTGNKGRWG